MPVKKDKRPQRSLSSCFRFGAVSKFRNRHLHWNIYTHSSVLKISFRNRFMQETLPCMVLSELRIFSCDFPNFQRHYLPSWRCGGSQRYHGEVCLNWDYNYCEIGTNTLLLWLRYWLKQEHGPWKGRCSSWTKCCSCYWWYIPSPMLKVRETWTLFDISIYQIFNE